MQNSAILFPLVAMAFWTFAITIYMGRARVRAVKTGQIEFAYFKTNQAERVPEPIVRIAQHYDNLFELNSLFYIVGIMLYLIQGVNLLSVSLAWAYFASRILHSVIHLGSNNVNRRFAVFLLSMGLLGSLWIMVFIGLLH